MVVLVPHAEPVPYFNVNCWSVVVVAITLALAVMDVINNAVCASRPTHPVPVNAVRDVPLLLTTVHTTRVPDWPCVAVTEGADKTNTKLATSAKALNSRIRISFRVRSAPRAFGGFFWRWGVGHMLFTRLRVAELRLRAFAHTVNAILLFGDRVGHTALRGLKRFNC